MTDSFLNLDKLAMGNAKSKRKGPLSRSKASSPFADSGKTAGNNHGSERDFSIEIHERWAEDPDLKIIKSTIERNPEMFVLNNLMMCVQFFENYDEEINDIRKTLVSTREAEMNARRLPQKHILIPDVLQEHVARRIDFSYMLPSLEHTTELLQPIRVYVVFENIEVTEESYAPAYSSVNESITYSMQLKPSPTHKGYVHLQRLEVNPPKKTASVDDLRMPSVVNESREEVYSDSESFYGNKFKKNGGRSKNVNNSMNEESVFEDSRLASQPNSGEFAGSNRAREGNGDGSLMEDSAAMRKEIEARRARMKSPQKQHGKSKSLNPAIGSPGGSTSSGYRSGNYTEIDSDYGYAQTSYSNTPKSSKSSLDDGLSSILLTELPRQCFKKLEFRGDGKIYDARREKKTKMTTKEQRIWQAYQSRNYVIWYLNSAKFMKYFCQLFTDQLAIGMGFDADINDSAHGSVIYRDKVEVLEGTLTTKLETFEIVPCVSSQWPQCAQEWLDRPRNSWPQHEVVERIRKFGCHIMPESAIDDKGTSHFHDLEWKLIFPAAERFLETCLSHSQARVYLIGLMLHKTYIRPNDSIFGLTAAHIKNSLFWLIEEDDRATKWMESRTGEALMRLLKSLYRAISQDEPNLPDFFIKGKNLFQEKSYLLRTQKQLKRIIENPVMYVFHALENMMHSRKFFPRLDYEELLKILTADILILINPVLAPRSLKSVSVPSAEKDYDHVTGFWDDVKRKVHEKPKSYVKKPARNRSLINPRKSQDQVIEIPMRCASMEPRRLSALLDFFIKHFIKMAEYCHAYSAMPQKTAYIEQAERLSVLLSEHPSHKHVAKEHIEKICSLKRRVANARTHGAPPETPRRNPDMPIFTRPMNDPSGSNELREENTLPAESDEEPEGRTKAQTTKAVIHGNDIDRSKILDSPPSNSDTTIREAGRSKRTARVVSLSEEPEESFLTETTYI
ncbi:uncharacterized protein [Venturia canescens]|uniref:uncharacterized protein n=1 Tax=Venturia canescens TaxID=32260 RepID=UPI001C9C8514|nr:uncharacterized protein LOC122408270 [Venturia canescens]